MSKIKGLRIYDDIVFSEEVQKYMYNLVKELPDWKKGKIGRETIHYGYEYDYSIREPHKKVLQKVKRAPYFLRCISKILYDDRLLRNYPNQIIINKYIPGQGISAHRDHYPIFDNDIATLSLGSPIVMEFKPHKSNKNIKHQDKKIELLLKPGSLLVFGDDARYKWTHEIKKRKTDKYNGKKLIRGERISITFRTVMPEYRG